MDYAEYFNASDWLLKVKASLPDPAPGPGGPPAHGYVRAPAPGTSRDFRRYHPIDPSTLQINLKILDIMKQSITSGQRKMIDLDPITKKYDRDPIYRIAFIYNRLNDWKQDMRMVFRSLTTDYPVKRIKQMIWYYENMLRLHIDITYTIESLVHLHGAYMTAKNF